MTPSRLAELETEEVDLHLIDLRVGRWVGGEIGAEPAFATGQQQPEYGCSAYARIVFRRERLSATCVNSRPVIRIRPLSGAA